MDDLPNDTNDIEKYVPYEKHLFIFIDGQSPSVTQSGEWMTVELSNTNQPTSGKRTSMGQLTNFGDTCTTEVLLGLWWKALVGSNFTQTTSG